MLALVVSHNACIVDERRFVKPDCDAVDLSIGRQVNIVNRTNQRDLLWIDFHEQVTCLCYVYVLNFREVLPIVTCHDVPEVDAAIFTCS